jgi:hypothetical protein
MFTVVSGEDAVAIFGREKQAMVDKYVRIYGEEDQDHSSV